MIADKITTRLTQGFSPDKLEVINESHHHAGHMGDDGSGESHFRVVIQADKFKKMSRLARHRAIHTCIGEDILAKIHALAIEAS